MIEVRIDASEVMTAMERLAKLGANPQPALQEAGEYLIASTKARFKSKQAPDGSPWESNSPAVIAEKGRDDTLTGESRRLSNEIHYRARGNLLEWGSSLEYAATQQLGAGKGDFGQTASGLPIPWGDIPAREFLGLSQEDSKTVVEVIEEHAQSAWHGKSP
jgi:phage virion morphogenesis protein